MSFTNNAEAGPSQKRLNSITNKQPKLELAEKVEIFPSTRLQDCLDYSILVSNNTSMARDQLANERNWLTWFRLSCTLIILGFTLLLQFRLPDSTDQDGNLTVSKANDFASKPIGFIFIGIGLSCFFVGVGKYFKSQRLLVKQATFVEAGWGSLVMVGILFCFVCSVMIMASINTSRNSFLNNP
ncbi:uncharacterized protein B0P05DRAFT_550307 [Gilbertella persicaria]|uniref:uncharacterized protein n=1 Tax=Gilbertella persicaria TaxID=101096 RepID=UPI00221F7E07|nr:uncharacterized protein B0P05DRAFT_550307 [Gilbertella persicaria]KAI8070588.1 hypothetical protein B0P05DRAFT_550307 [Gilbertella persicaria]